MSEYKDELVKTPDQADTISFTTNGSHKMEISISDPLEAEHDEWEEQLSEIEDVIEEVQDRIDELDVE